MTLVVPLPKWFSIYLILPFSIIFAVSLHLIYDTLSKNYIQRQLLKNGVQTKAIIVNKYKIHSIQRFYFQIKYIAMNNNNSRYISQNIQSLHMINDDEHVNGDQNGNIQNTKNIENEKQKTVTKYYLIFCKQFTVCEEIYDKLQSSDIVQIKYSPNNMQCFIIDNEIISAAFNDSTLMLKIGKKIKYQLIIDVIVCLMLMFFAVAQLIFGKYIIVVFCIGFVLLLMEIFFDKKFNFDVCETIETEICNYRT